MYPDIQFGFLSDFYFDIASGRHTYIDIFFLTCHLIFYSTFHLAFVLTFYPAFRSGAAATVSCDLAIMFGSGEAQWMRELTRGGANKPLNRRREEEEKEKGKEKWRRRCRRIDWLGLTSGKGENPPPPIATFLRPWRSWHIGVFIHIVLAIFQNSSSRNKLYIPGMVPVLHYHVLITLIYCTVTALFLFAQRSAKGK